MKTLLPKKASYFLAVLGAAFFITIAGCKKDQTNSDVAILGSAKNGTLSTLSNSKNAVNGLKGGCIDDVINAKIGDDPFGLTDAYFACKFGSSVSKGPVVPSHPPIGDTPELVFRSNSDEIEALFISAGMNAEDKNDPAKVAQLKLLIAPCITVINNAGAMLPLNFGEVGFAVANPLTVCYIVRNYPSVSSSVVYVGTMDFIEQIMTTWYYAQPNAYHADKWTPGFVSHSSGQKDNPLWNQLGLDKILLPQNNQDL